MAYSPNRTHRLAGKACGLYDDRIAIPAQYSVTVNNPLFLILASVRTRNYLTVSDGLTQRGFALAPKFTGIQKRYKSVEPCQKRNHHAYPRLLRHLRALARKGRHCRSPHFREGTCSNVREAQQLESGRTPKGSHQRNAERRWP